MLQAAATKALHLTKEVVVKYQQFVRFAIGPHAIHVWEWQDPNKQWLPTTYKVFDVDMEAIIDDWPQEWHELQHWESVNGSPNKCIGGSYAKPTK